MVKLKKLVKNGIVILSLITLLSACGSGDSAAGTIESASGSAAADTAAGEESAGEMAGENTEEAEEVIPSYAVERQELSEDDPIRDNDALYEGEDRYSVVTMYLTVSSGNETDVTNHTWTEINSHSNYDYDDNGIDRYNVEGLLQVGDENGPAEGELGYGETTPNCAIQIKGQSSSKAEQKSYKIRLKDGKGSWRDQKTISLIKYPSDRKRFTNKMDYDFLTDIPQTLSARTQFVHLYVKDTTEGGNGSFVDYGIYTQVEQINKTYLESHGLDRNGQLYKVTFFEFYEYPEVMKLETDDDYDEAAFEEYLEIKGSSDHAKLNEVIEAVNDYSVQIDDIVDKYFDVENLCYFCAFQILIGNTDTSARNLFYYSPLNSEKWYIISWDMDGSFEHYYNLSIGRNYGNEWEQGITKFTNVVLFDRMFREQKYRDALCAAIDDLYENYLSEDQVRERANKYAATLIPYLYGGGDSANVKIKNVEEYKDLVAHLPYETTDNYKAFYESLNKPFPVYLGTPEPDGNGNWDINWDISIDPNRETVLYEWICATSPFFEPDSIIYDEKDLRVPGVTVEALPAGKYYTRLIMRNESGYQQYCYDYHTWGNAGKIYGCKGIQVAEDGTITLLAVKLTE